MNSLNVYLKCDRNVETSREDVLLKDLGSIRCSDRTVTARLKTVRVHRFRENAPKRIVISVLRIIELMEETCPGISVEVVGEADVLIEKVNPDSGKGFLSGLKTAMVCLVSFCGTAFTIVAYHVDVEINKVFALIYRFAMGREPDGVNVMQIAYSAGVFVGIIIFFNHVGGRRITKDPTPIEVAMRKYEQDVDVTLIENAEREEIEEDVR